MKTCVIPPALHCVLANVFWTVCCCCCAHCCSCLPFLTCSVRMKLGRRHPQLHMSECNNPFILHCCCAPCALYQEALWMKKTYGDYKCCYYTCCMKTFCFPKAWPKSLWWISLESTTFRKTFKERPKTPKKCKHAFAIKERLALRHANHYVSKPISLASNGGS